MKTTLAVVLAAALLPGCKKSSTSQCADAIGKGVDKMIAMRKDRLAAQGSAMPPELKARMDERAKKMDEVASSLKQAMTNRCTEDKWSDDVIKCYGTATAMEEIRKCREKLPQDQQDKLKAEEMQVMMKTMGGPGGPSAGGMPGHPGMGDMPPGHEGMGSAMGGAGMGGSADQNGAPPAVPPTATAPAAGSAK